MTSDERIFFRKVLDCIERAISLTVYCANTKEMVTEVERVEAVAGIEKLREDLSDL